jgi:putative heme transporter
VSSGLQAAAISFSFLGWISITLIMSIYVAIDMPRLGDQLTGLANQSGYRDDFQRLARSFNRIWDAYLRGQLILGVIIALITSAMLAALGVQNWLALGLLSGVLQVIPYVGPTVSAVFIVLFALFQPSNYLGLTPGIYALVVGAVTLVVQQVSGNILLPTVVGDALNMSALAVLISLIVGFAVAGVMGVILAAPVVASLKLITSYIWRKLLDLPPFPDEEPPPTQVSAIFRRSQEMMQQIRNRKDTGPSD